MQCQNGGSNLEGGDFKLRGGTQGLNPRGILKFIDPPGWASGSLGLKKMAVIHVQGDPAQMPDFDL